MARGLGLVVLALSVLLSGSADAFLSSPAAGTLRRGQATSPQSGRAQLRSWRRQPQGVRRGALGVQACDATDGEGFRAAAAADQSLIAQMVKQENMNPLFLDVANFLIAQDDEQQVVGIGQIRPLGKQYELASLVVRKDMRGNGIGTALVNELLERHKAKCLAGVADPATAVLPDVFLLTITTNTPFYSRMGFLEIPVSMAPMGMQMEAAAGTFVAKLSGAQLTCMRYKFPSTELKCSGSGTILKQANEI